MQAGVEAESEFWAQSVLDGGVGAELPYAGGGGSRSYLPTLVHGASGCWDRDKPPPPVAFSKAPAGVEC